MKVICNSCLDPIDENKIIKLTVEEYKSLKMIKYDISTTTYSLDEADQFRYKLCSSCYKKLIEP